MAKKSAPEPAPASPTPPLAAQEKALSDTLMKELKTSEAQAPATPVSPPAPPTPTSAEPPPLPPPETATPPAASTPEKAEEAPKKKGFLHFPLPFKKKTPAKVETVPSEPATPETTQLTNEVLIQMVDEKLKKLSGDDFLVIKISKQGLFVLTGLILILIWVVPLFNYGIKHLPLPKASPTPVPSISPVATDSATVDWLSQPIRVRMGTNTLEAAETVKGLLKAKGFTSIDIVYDKQVNPASLLIATRQGKDDLRQKLTEVFTPTYQVASDSASLTEDSSFAASILVGKNSFKK